MNFKYDDILFTTILKTSGANTRLVHWLTDVHSGSFAPAFTLSQGDSELFRKPPIVSVNRLYKN